MRGFNSLKLHKYMKTPSYEFIALLTVFWHSLPSNFSQAEHPKSVLRKIDSFISDIHSFFFSFARYMDTDRHTLFL